MSSASTSATSTNSVHTERSTYDRRIAAAEPILRPQRPFTRLRSDGATSSADCSTNTKPRREDRVCAPHALEKVLARLGPGGRAATMTLGELVDEYLEMHQAEPVTLAKLRWLLGKATATFGEVRLAVLSPRDVYAWHLTIPDLHLYDAAKTEI